jgi:ParE toxin of type II toxin-antitoxin system, parDE
MLSIGHQLARPRALAFSGRFVPDHPYVYREGRKPNTREMVVLPNYIIVYRIKRDRIQIVNVLHARRRYPEFSSLRSSRTKLSASTLLSIQTIRS